MSHYDWSVKKYLEDTIHELRDSLQEAWDDIKEERERYISMLEAKDEEVHKLQERIAEFRALVLEEQLYNAREVNDELLQHLLTFVERSKRLSKECGEPNDHNLLVANLPSKFVDENLYTIVAGGSDDCDHYTPTDSPTEEDKDVHFRLASGFVVGDGEPEVGVAFTFTLGKDFYEALNKSFGGEHKDCCDPLYYHFYEVEPVKDPETGLVTPDNRTVFIHCLDGRTLRYVVEGGSDVD